MKPKIIIISGATATGKSAFSIEVAKKFNGEIISADSMQIYKGLDIGTGKITKSEMQGIKHNLIDIKEPNEEYSVSDFVNECEDKINEIILKDKLPIIVGGTGFYINALLNKYNFADAGKSEELRTKLNSLNSEKGSDYLYENLMILDKASAEKISNRDSKRIIRALEIYYLTGKPKSEIIESSESKYDYYFIILEEERQQLYKKINDRVDKMIVDGLMAEANKLACFKNCQSMQAIGYKEFFSEDNKDVKLIIEKIKQNSRNYAKRQMTYLRWLKAEKHFFNLAQNDSILIKIRQFISTMSDIVQE